MIHKRAVVLAMAFGVAVLSSCSRGPSHPPKFADFHRAGPGVMEDEKKLAELHAVFERAQLSPSDIASIRKRGNAREIIGAAMQTAIGDESSALLVKEGLARGSNNPVIVTGAIKSVAQQAFREAPDKQAVANLLRLLDELERLEADNGLSLCLRAYAHLKSGDTNAARSTLQSAMRKPVLRLHGSELRRCVMEAALAVKYPRYTSSMVALGSLGMSTEIVLLGKRLMNDPQLDRATAEAVLELGRRQEAQATLFIDQLIASSLQKQALEFLKPPGFEKELERMKEARERIKRATEFLDSARAHKLSEDKWNKYYEKVFAKSELEAANDLAARMGRKL